MYVRRERSFDEAGREREGFCFHVRSDSEDTPILAFEFVSTDFGVDVLHAHSAHRRLFLRDCLLQTRQRMIICMVTAVLQTVT